MNTVVRDIVYGYAYEYGPLSVTLTSLIERITTDYIRTAGDLPVAMFMADYWGFDLRTIAKLQAKGQELLPIE